MVRHEIPTGLMRAADYQALAARFDEGTGDRRYALTERTARAIGRALRFYADVLNLPREELGFTVDIWREDGVLLQNMARSSHALVAQAAFQVACEQRMGSRVTLRHGVRMIQDRHVSNDSQESIGGPTAPEET